MAEIEHGIPSTTQVFGTSSYMAPEALRGAPCKLSDVWSVGVVFYALVVGRPLFPLDAADSAIEDMVHSEV